MKHRIEELTSNQSNALDAQPEITNASTVIRREITTTTTRREIPQPYGEEYKWPPGEFSEELSVIDDDAVVQQIVGPSTPSMATFQQEIQRAAIKLRDQRINRMQSEGGTNRGEGSPRHSSPRGSVTPTPSSGLLTDLNTGLPTRNKMVIRLYTSTSHIVSANNSVHASTDGAF